MDKLFVTDSNILKKNNSFRRHPMIVNHSVQFKCLSLTLADRLFTIANATRKASVLNALLLHNRNRAL